MPDRLKPVQWTRVGQEYNNKPLSKHSLHFPDCSTVTHTMYTMLLNAGVSPNVTNKHFSWQDCFALTFPWLLVNFPDISTTAVKYHDIFTFISKWLPTGYPVIRLKLFARNRIIVWIFIYFTCHTHTHTHTSGTKLDRQHLQQRHTMHQVKPDMLIQS